MGADFSEIQFRPFQREDLTEMYLAFTDAFKDYPLPVRMTLEDFHQKFAGRLCISFEYSAGAWHGERLAAFLFVSHHKSTLYISSAGVRTAFRGNNLLRKLLLYQETLLPGNNPFHFFLDVLTENRQAIHIFRSMNYETGRTLVSFIRQRHIQPHTTDFNLTRVSELPWESIGPWSNEPFPFLNSEAVVKPGKYAEEALGHYDHHGLAGIIAFHPASGRIPLLRVRPDFRRRGLGRCLLHAAENRCASDDLHVLNVPLASRDMKSFLEAGGFRQECEMLEMKKSL